MDFLTIRHLHQPAHHKKLKKKDTKTKKESEADKDIVKQLKELKELLDTGVLSKEEFEKAKKKLLN